MDTSYLYICTPTVICIALLGEHINYVFDQQVSSSPHLFAGGVNVELRAAGLDVAYREQVAGLTETCLNWVVLGSCCNGYVGMLLRYLG